MKGIADYVLPGGPFLWRTAVETVNLIWVTYLHPHRGMVKPQANREGIWNNQAPLPFGRVFYLNG